MYDINDPRFKKLVCRNFSLEELEKRLRPASLGVDGYDKDVTAHAGFGDFSYEGFIGQNEKLLELIHSDWQVVEQCRTTHQEIADALAGAIATERMPSQRYKIEYKLGSGGSQSCPWPCKTKYQHSSCVTSICDVERASDLDELSLLTRVAGNREEAQANVVKALEQIKSAEGVDDELVKSADSMTAIFSAFSKDERDLTDRINMVTELHPHLIREHYFFEGRESPYRADPELLIKAFGLGIYSRR